MPAVVTISQRGVKKREIARHVTCSVARSCAWCRATEPRSRLSVGHRPPLILVDGAREAGGEVFLWGISSGAVLALEAAGQIRGVRKLALYEAPLIVNHSRPTTENDWRRIR